MTRKADFPSAIAIERAASQLLCRVSTLRAIAEVEAGENGAFLDSGEPVILYEPHVFSRLTNHIYDGYAIDPNLPHHSPISKHDLGRDIMYAAYPKRCYISYVPWKRGWYGPVGFQHTRLHVATLLDRDAALMACSWGLYQILGENYKRCGFSSVQHMVNAMYKSVDEHLQALVGFVKGSKKMWDAVKNRDAVAFARLYNGSGFRKNRYDDRLREAGF